MEKLTPVTLTPVTLTPVTLPTVTLPTHHGDPVASRNGAPLGSYKEGGDQDVMLVFTRVHGGVILQTLSGRNLTFNGEI